MNRCDSNHIRQLLPLRQFFADSLATFFFRQMLKSIAGSLLARLFVSSVSVTTYLATKKNAIGLDC